MPSDDSVPQAPINSSASAPSATPTGQAKPLQKPTLTDWWNAAKTVKPDDYRNIERVPCMKQSLVYGIAGGSAIGCTRYLSSNPLVASNWAVASFVLIAAASWHRCRGIQAAQKEQIQIIRDQLVEKAKRRAPGGGPPANPATTGSSQEK
ncbi:hypothetical protein M408DRAFT_329509 [Serendipita vermifera MAFF 305830]|uniref:Cytochrome c oxidase assembly protein COX20, mitochondrial n=1 Tax=Serendipita vermifera MAFF 305830 TaxID=933852 RepID=A0A0C2WQI0_SERVB|nr:hypothetical protein M408DRAFT_329509 [Serendipita vermifera MAFF 305830]